MLAAIIIILLSRSLHEEGGPSLPGGTSSVPAERIMHENSKLSNTRSTKKEKLSEYRL